MCTSPKKILNPKLKSGHSSFNPAIDPLYLKVPCGKCRQCQIHRQQDILVRLAYEYEYTMKQGGFALMETFTYNEDNVPEWHGLKCFNRNHYTIFAKKLRTYLVRDYEERARNMSTDGNIFGEPYLYEPEYFEEKNKHYEEIQGILDAQSLELDSDLFCTQNKTILKYPAYPNMHPKGKLKIFWVSEYGGEYNRPHYHAIIFVTFDIDPQHFRELIDKSWIYGFTDKRHISKLIIKDFKAVAYVSKYVCKDIEWIKTITQQKGSSFTPYFKTRWKELYEEEFNEKKLKEMPCDTIKKLLKDIGMSEAIPFNSWSKGIGLYAISKITDRDMAKGEMTVRDKNHTWKRISIPEYLQRKLYYDYNKQIKMWEINEKGKIKKANQVEHTYQRTIINLDIIMNQTRIEGVNNEYKQRLFEIIYTDKNRYNELITTIIHRDKLITHELNRLLKKNHTWKEIVTEELMNGIDNVTKFAYTDKHLPHTWLYYALRYKTNKYLHIIDATHPQIKELITFYDMGIEQIQKARERRLQTVSRAERVQKNRFQGGNTRL